MEKLVLENEQKIEKFDIEFYINSQNYPVASALSALETTNEIQKSYFKKQTEELEVCDHVLRLYALLQGLFVSVDSLYALAFSLTKSKSFININKNQDLRDLKYIRNDVVGHPANRVYNSDTPAYCILDNLSISKTQFSYFVYSTNGVTVKTIDLEKLVTAYYLECNSLLSEIYNIADADKNQSSLGRIASQVVDLYMMGVEYQDALKKLKKTYLKEYPSASSSQHRVVWRVELIDRLKRFQPEDEDVKDLIDYSIGLEIIKIYQLITNQSYEMSTGKKKPFLVSSFYRFLNKTRNLFQAAQQITDISHPLFAVSMEQLIGVARKKKSTGPLRYLLLLKKLYDKKEDELLYALALPIKEYRKKLK